jgi:hypothetical protein
MVLSLSPGETPLAVGEHVAAHANMWRISDDFWDHWPELLKQFERLRNWVPFAGPGHYPDADMLPLGKIRFGKDTRFTRDEQRTLITLWCMARSPLMFGGDLPSNDAFTESLLTNDEVLAANQRGDRPRKFWQQGDAVIWTSELGGARYYAAFNIGEESGLEITIPATGRFRDVWKAQDLGTFDRTYKVKLLPHTSAMYLVK